MRIDNPASRPGGQGESEGSKMAKRREAVAKSRERMRRTEREGDEHKGNRDAAKRISEKVRNERSGQRDDDAKPASQSRPPGQSAPRPAGAASMPREAAPAAR